MPSVSNANPLYQAVFRGCVECIRMLVETPPYYSVDAVCGPDGIRPIHIAAREGHIQSLRYLSAAGACLQKSDVNGTTALHHASIAGQLRAVRWLLRHGANILLDKRGRSPIQAAADHDHMEIVSILARQATCGTFKDSKDTVSNATRIEGNYKDTSSEGIQCDPSTAVTPRPNDSGRKDNEWKEIQIDANGDKTSSPVNSENNDCASSSGNSSLAATSASSPSLSPSATSAASSSTGSCGCSPSKELEDIAIKGEVPSSERFGVSGNKSGNNETYGESNSPFFLHPPTNGSNPNSVLLSNGAVTPVSIPNWSKEERNSKKSNQSRTETPSSCPFFLHPPENLISETQKAVSQKMAPAPVNPNHGHLHVAELINEAQSPKIGKLTLPSPDDISSTVSSASSTSSCSPPPTPPSMKTTTAEIISKYQSAAELNGSINNKCKDNNNNHISNGISDAIKNDINNVKSKSIKSGPPPPPPPPPMPTFNEPFENRNGISNGHGVHNGDAGDTAENEYEDIDYIQCKMEANNGFGKNLTRSVSAPLHVVVGNGSQSQNEENRYGPPQLIGPKMPMLGKPGVPFIPPHFPTTPEDCLIKPSEYLKQIQQIKSKGSSCSPPTLNGINGNGISNGSHQTKGPSPRVEEAIKALKENNPSAMASAPEETNVEDEFEEINLERINALSQNGNHKVPNGTENGLNGNAHAYTNGNGVPTASPVIPGGTNAHPAVTKLPPPALINSEQLMKVNLRKTPMSRTQSAPPVGRVIPDEELRKEAGLSNGHSQLALNSTNGSNDVNNRTGLETLRKPELTRTGKGTGELSKAAVIAELAESSQLGGVREWKEELRRRQIEEEKAVQKEIAQYYQPVNFVAEVPQMDTAGAPIPVWKRQMLAKKAAERARKEAEEQLKHEIEAKRIASIPMWRRQLLQRRDSEGKYAQ